jgi:hypothetical protein
MFLFSVRFPSPNDEMLLTLSRYLEAVRKTRKGYGEVWPWARWGSLPEQPKAPRYVRSLFTG